MRVPTAELGPWARHRPARGLWLAVALPWAWAIGATGWAQEPQPQTRPLGSAATRAVLPASRPSASAAAEQLSQWLAELGSGDTAVRERARESLMGLRRDDLEALRAVVQRSRPLLPSQAAVLRDVVTQGYLSGEAYAVRGDAGFLGVRLSEVSISPSGAGHANHEERDGVVIFGRIPGFCGFRSLQEGDVILAIAEDEDWAELPLHSAGDLQAAIMGRKAGQTVRLRVLRQGQVRTVAVKLDGRPAGIDAPVGPDDPSSFEQVRRRREQKGEQYWQQAFAPLLEGATP